MTTDSPASADSHSAGPEPPSYERAVRRTLLTLCVFLVLLAVGVELRDIRQFHLGRSQGLLIGLAGLLGVMGALGPRRVAAYRAVALILLNTLIVVVLVEIASATANFVLGSIDEPAPLEFNTARANPYFRDKEWAEAFWLEHAETQGLAESYHPYVIWRGAPHAGQFVRVDAAGVRVTVGGACPNGAFRIVMFGSSALYGWGVPDEGTIASFLQVALAKRDRPVCVQNRGQNGWVSTQDLIEFVRLLQQGETFDLAIFYNGFNDAGAVFETHDAGSHYMVDVIAGRMKGPPKASVLRSVLDATATWQLLSRATPKRRRPGGSWPALDAGALEQLKGEAVHAYLKNLDFILAIARDAGIDVAVFWQPYARWGRSVGDTALVPGAGSFSGREGLVHAVYRAIRDTATFYPSLHFLADSMTGAPPSDWLDFVHLSPTGNARVAELIQRLLAGQLPP